MEEGWEGKERYQGEKEKGDRFGKRVHHGLVCEKTRESRDFEEVLLYIEINSFQNPAI